jgi:hypothetical protein
MFSPPLKFVQGNKCPEEPRLTWAAFAPIRKVGSKIGAALLQGANSEFGSIVNLQEAFLRFSETYLLSALQRSVSTHDGDLWQNPRIRITFIINESPPQGRKNKGQHIWRVYVTHGSMYLLRYIRPRKPPFRLQRLQKEVVEAIKELNVPAVRYSGGAFVTTYHWLDGVGPKESRPKRPELA